MTHTISKVAATTLAATVALTAFSGVAFAERGGWDRGHKGGDETEVKNYNSANITNEVTVKAYTGENTSTGGDGNDGGDGGYAGARGDDNATANAGSGGRGGNGAAGGAIFTGDATAWGTVNNDVNRNNTHIEGCGCDDEDAHGWMHWFKKNSSDEEVEVENKNRATLLNDLYVKADTGENDSEGGEGGEAGDGGAAEATAKDGKKDKRDRGWKMWFHMMHGDDDDDYATANGGNGGNGGNGAEGGYIETGDAYSDGLITNTVNRNVTRINRGGDES